MNHVLLAMSLIAGPAITEAALQEREGFERLAEGAYREALEVFERAVATAPEHAPAHYGRGLALSGLLRYREATASFETAVELDPGHEAAWTELVVLYGQLGEREEARRALAHIHNPSDPLRLARALRKIGLFQEARSILPETAHAELGTLAAAEGHCEEALSHFERATERSAAIELDHARCLEQLGRDRPAIEHYRAALDADPHLRPARFRLGNLLLRVGERSEGLRLLDGYEAFRQWERRTKLLLAMVTSGTLSPADQRLKTLELIDLYIQGGALDEAEALVRSGRARTGGDASYAVARARLALAKGEPDAARRALDAIPGEPPPEATWLSARLYMTAGNPQAAIDAYEHYLERAEDPPARLLKELATAYAMTGDATTSEQLFERAIAADPDLAEARADWGLLLESLGRVAEAEVKYREALSLDPNLVAAEQGLASLMLSKGELDTAEALFRQSVERHPEDPDLRRNLALVLRKLGREDEARAELERARKLER